MYKKIMMYAVIALSLTSGFVRGSDKEPKINETQKTAFEYTLKILSSGDVKQLVPMLQVLKDRKSLLPTITYLESQADNQDALALAMYLRITTSCFPIEHQSDPDPYVQKTLKSLKNSAHLLSNVLWAHAIDRNDGSVSGYTGSDKDDDYEAGDPDMLDVARTLLTKNDILLKD
ncbi:MAG: hypothetical protein PVJ92_01880 [Candidatus Dependentiae bacterium]|jgi:hypothetical protein